MLHSTSNERGAAMVLVLGVLAALAVLAMVVTAVVVTEKRTSHAEYDHQRAFYSADAAGEAGLAWIRNQPSPPALVDTLNRVAVAAAPVALAADHAYQYDVKYVRKAPRPGWSVEYKDFEYTVEARGASSRQAESAVELGAKRLFREGY